MYCGSGTVASDVTWTQRASGQLADATAHAAESGGQTSWACGHRLESMTPVISKIRLRQSMPVYLKNNPDKFHPDPIWNDGALGFFWRGSPQ